MKKASIKNLIIIVGIVVVLLVLYVLFVKPSGSPSSSTLSSSQTGETPLQPQTSPSSVSSAGDSLLRILNNLEGLELNDSIFFNPAFGELRDISIPLVKEGNAGRRNPFAPIGKDPVPVPVNNGSVGQNIAEQDTLGDATLEDNTGTTDNETDQGEGFGIFGS